MAAGSWYFLRNIPAGRRLRLSESKQPVALGHGLFLQYQSRKLTGVSLSQACGFAFFMTHDDLSCSPINRVHGDGMMGGANLDAQLATFATIVDHNRFDFGLVYQNTIGLWAIHDAKPASFFRDTFFLINKSYVVHQSSL
jgi:hypothetical protein